MTEKEAKNIVRHCLEQEATGEFSLILVGDVYAETSEAFIIEGSWNLKKEEFDEEFALYAVHKITGECGQVFPPLGIIIDKEYLEKNFSWDASWMGMWTVPSPAREAEPAVGR